MSRRTLLIILGCAVTCASMAYADLVWRARGAYLEGEKYMQWHLHPELKQSYFDNQFNEHKARLEADKKAGHISEMELNQRLELAKFERDDAIKESSVKYAYHWFSTAAKLFSPPESRWVRLSRERMAEAKMLWKQELDAAKIPYQDYMLE